MHVDALDCLEIGSRGFRICLNHFVSRARLSTRGNVSRRERLRGNTHEKTSAKNDYETVARIAVSHEESLS